MLNLFQHDEVIQAKSNRVRGFAAAIGFGLLTALDAVRCLG